MHGKKQKPSPKALEGRARKAAAAEATLAAAAAKAEAEEAARWHVGAPDLSAQHARAQRQRAKRQAKEERDAQLAKEEYENQARSWDVRRLIQWVRGDEELKKVAKLEIEEQILMARDIDDALDGIVTRVLLQEGYKRQGGRVSYGRWVRQSRRPSYALLSATATESPRWDQIKLEEAAKWRGMYEQYRDRKGAKRRAEERRSAQEEYREWLNEICGGKTAITERLREIDHEKKQRRNGIEEWSVSRVYYGDSDEYYK